MFLSAVPPRDLMSLHTDLVFLGPFDPLFACEKYHVGTKASTDRMEQSAPSSACPRRSCPRHARGVAAGVSLRLQLAFISNIGVWTYYGEKCMRILVYLLVCLLFVCGVKYPVGVFFL